MYAVIETGGKQYRVEVGTELEVEKLDAEAGATVTLDRVLLVADGDDASIGQPIVDGASVSAEVVRQDRADKVIVFKYRPKARRRVKKGHRQDITVLRVSDITVGGRSAAAAAEQAAEDVRTERQRVEEAAAKQAAADAALAAKLAERTAKATEPEPEAKPKTARARGKGAQKPEGEAAEVIEPAKLAEVAEPVGALEPAAAPEPTPTAETADTAEASEAAETPSARAFEIFEDKAGQWRWRLRASNGEILAMSEQGFASKASVVRSLESVRRNVAEALDHVEAEEGAEAGATAGFEIYEDKAGQWRWRLRASNGELLAIPEQGYSSKASVVRALESVRRHVAEALTHEDAGTAEETTTSDAPPRKRASRIKKDE